MGTIGYDGVTMVYDWVRLGTTAYDWVALGAIGYDWVRMGRTIAPVNPQRASSYTFVLLRNVGRFCENKHEWFFTSGIVRNSYGGAG